MSVGDLIPAPNYESIGTFEAVGLLNLLMSSIGKEGKTMRISYWQFNLANFALLQKDVLLVDFPFNKNKDSDFSCTSARTKLTST